MSELTEKYLKRGSTNIFTEWKESMRKEAEEGMMVTSHQIENISKDVETIEKN